jgi:transposase
MTEACDSGTRDLWGRSLMAKLSRAGPRTRGKTPVLKSRDRHDRLSAISAITISPSRSRLRPYFLLLPDDTNVRGGDTVAFLRESRRQLSVPMTVLWDRGNVHDRSKAVRAYLAGHPAIETEPFPSYTPEANPYENVWGHAKHGRRANFTPEDTDELHRVLVESWSGCIAVPSF